MALGVARTFCVRTHSISRRPYSQYALYAASIAVTRSRDDPHMEIDFEITLIVTPPLSRHLG